MCLYILYIYIHLYKSIVWTSPSGSDSGGHWVPRSFDRMAPLLNILGVYGDSLWVPRPAIRTYGPDWSIWRQLSVQGVLRPPGRSVPVCLVWQCNSNQSHWRSIRKLCSSVPQSHEMCFISHRSITHDPFNCHVVSLSAGDGHCGVMTTSQCSWTTSRNPQHQALKNDFQHIIL